jgi:hypothetical protein
MSGRARAAAAAAKTVGRWLGMGRSGARAVGPTVRRMAGRVPVQRIGSRGATDGRLATQMIGRLSAAGRPAARVVGAPFRHMAGASGRYRAGLRGEIGAQMNEPTLSALGRFAGRGSAGVQQLNTAPLGLRETLRAGALPHIPKHLGGSVLKPTAATAGAMVIADPVVRAGKGVADFLASPSQFTQEGFQPRKDLPRSLAPQRTTPQPPSQRTTPQPPSQQPGIGATVSNLFGRAKRTLTGLPGQVGSSATTGQPFDPLSAERRKALDDKARNEIIGITFAAAKDRIPGMGTKNRTDSAIYGMIRDFVGQGAGYAARQGLEKGKGAYGLTLPRILRAPTGAFPIASAEVMASGVRGGLDRVLPTQRPSIKTIVHAGLKAEFGPALAKIKGTEGLERVQVHISTIRDIAIDLAESETLQRVGRIGATMKGYNDDEFIQQLEKEYDLQGQLLPWYQIAKKHGPTALRAGKWAYRQMGDDQ